MEGIHPPETSQKPPIYESLGPTSKTSVVCWAEFSSVDNLLAIGYNDGLVEIFELVDKDWVVLYTFRRTDSVHGAGPVQESPVSAIRWHPALAHDMLVGFCNGSAHILSFLDQSGENFGKAKSVKIIDFSLTHFTATIDWRLTTLDHTASKLIGVVGEDMFIYRGPFSDHIFDLTVFRPLPRRVVQHEPLNIWYLDDDHVSLVVHPLGISWVSMYPRRLMHTIPLQDNRTLTFATISPNKDVIVAINIRGDAAIYSVKYKQFIHVLREEAGIYRPLISAIFYGHYSLVLAFADKPELEVIPDLDIGANQRSRQIILLRSNELPYPAGSSLKVYDSAIIYGVGHILVAKPNRKPGSDLSIVIPSNIQFYTTEPIANSSLPEDRGDPQAELETPAVPNAETPAVPNDEAPAVLVDETTAVLAGDEPPAGLSDETPTVNQRPVKYWKIPGFPVGFAKW